MDNFLKMSKKKESDNRIIFITGGARSGKSTYAQQMAMEMGHDVLFIATAEPLDDEMRERIQNHRLSRPEHWQTLELPRNLAQELKNIPVIPPIALIDCITLLVSNLIQQDKPVNKLEKIAIAEISELIEFISATGSVFIIVSNEVGLGVVPDNKMARDYRDILGKVNQLIARSADEVYFMISGIPQRIK
jgi:adenosylcobinamide kinase/adenosylcobinamide-phosphate guanylyltransferase